MSGTVLPVADLAAGGAPQASLPTVDQLLGTEPPSLPTVDELLGPEPEQEPMSGSLWDSFFTHTAAGRVLDAFGHGVAQAWGTSPLGMSPSVEDALKRVGVLPDIQKGQEGPIRAINEAVMRPAAAGLDALYRAGNAAFSGAQGIVAQIGAEAGYPLLGRDIAVMPEAFLGTPHPMGLPSLPEAADLEVIGGTETQWEGTETAPSQTPEQAVAARVKQAQQTAAANANEPGAMPATFAPTEQPGEAPMQPHAMTPLYPTDVHAAARRIAPEAFQQFDTLSTQRDTLRAQIAMQMQDIQQKAEAQAPHAAEIADLEQRLQDTTPRLAKKYQDRLQVLLPERNAFLSDEFTMGALTRDTPEIAALREELQQADYKMRDLSPQVTAAYQQAGRMFPEPMEAAGAAEAAQEQPPQEQAPVVPVEAQPEPQPEPPQQQPSQPQSAPVEEGVAAQPQEAPEPVNITQDVTQKLLAAGRPADEADAAAALVASHYEARAARFAGAKGTAEEMYRRDAPEIVAGGEGGRGGAATGKIRLRTMELAQRGQGATALRNARNTITLFRKADASTFLHETGHAWLEEMLGDARDPAAPDDLRQDAEAVRKWARAKGDKPLTTRQHEAFARGFERYMMEGLSPSRALDHVFAKFRDWLTTIYRTVQRLRAPITPDIRHVFDRLLTRTPERSVVAPEREFVSKEAPSRIYVNPGREPTRLVSFLRRKTVLNPGTIHETTIPGGIRDSGGDLRAILGGPKARPGLINDATGRTLDEAARHAGEAGYFPELGDERPTINDLLNAISDDLGSSPRYSHFDQEAVEIWRQTQDYNAEIDRLASEHGIPTHGVTRDEFFDKLTAKLTAEQAADEKAALEAAHDEVHGEMMGDVREMGAEAGLSEPATLEDLENVHRQEAAALAARAGEESNGRPTDAGRSAGAGEEGLRPGGRAPGDTGRGGSENGAAEGGSPGAERPEQPTAAPGRIPDEPQPELIDKAGNIRLDLTNWSGDVRSALKQLAAQNGDFMEARGGVVSDAVRLSLADAVNATTGEMNIERLRAMTMEDGVSPSTRLQAARLWVPQAADAWREAAARAATTGSEADLLAATEAELRIATVAETLSAATAEWGRSGRALQDLKRMLAEGSVNVADALKKATGRTLFQQRLIASGVAGLDTSAKIAKFARDAARPGLFDWIQSAFVNALLSGPLTHSTYLVAADLYAAFRGIAETGLSGAVGTVRRALGGEGGAEFGEVPAQLYGLFRGATNGTKAAWQAFKSGVPQLPEEVEARPILPGTVPVVRPGVIPGRIGQVIELPSRAIAAFHTYNWTTFYSQSIAGQAYQAAREEGLTDGDLSRRIAALIEKPSRQMIETASNDAASGSLMARPKRDSFMGKVSDLTNHGWAVGDLPLPGGRSLPLGTLRPLKFIDPFVQITANIQRMALGRGTPLELFKGDTRADLMGRNGSAAFDRTAGRLIAGTSFMVAAGWLAARGLLNGSGPTQPAQAAEWRRIHGMPHGLNVGGLSFDTLRLGPLGLQMSVAADLYHVADQAESHDASAVAGQLAFAFGENILDESFMRGPAAVIQAAEDPGRYGGAWARGFFSSMIPFSVGLSQVTHEIDPYSRQSRTMMDAILAKIPGASETLPRRYDVWGQPARNWKWAGTYYTEAQDDPLDRVLYQLHVWPSPVRRTVRGVQLSDQQYDEYAMTAGRIAKMRLDALIRGPGFGALPPVVQVLTIHSTLTGAREQAAGLLQMRNPQIIQEAVEAKRKLAGGSR
ncbi:MAG: hypothetical protein ACREDC_00125 [Bradyrhizobium sp.]